MLEDRYLEGTRLRLRKSTCSASGDVVYKLGQKLPCGPATHRKLTNLYLSQGEHRLLANLPARALCKRRYRIGELVLDVLESGLMLAEAEFASEEEMAGFVPPVWVGEEVSLMPEWPL